jgi:transcriptional regulator with XRE-family HTH domain
MVKHVAHATRANPGASAMWKLVGERLKVRRSELGLMVARVAEDVVVSEDTYERYEAGDAQVPAALLARIAERFGVPVLWFFQDVVPPPDNDGEDAPDPDTPRVYRVTTLEQRVDYLADSFRKLDLEGQQHLLAIVGALSRARGRQLRG